MTKEEIEKVFLSCGATPKTNTNGSFLFGPNYTEPYMVKTEVINEDYNEVNEELDI